MPAVGRVGNLVLPSGTAAATARCTPQPERKRGPHASLLASRPDYRRQRQRGMSAAAALERHYRVVGLDRERRETSAGTHHSRGQQVGREGRCRLRGSAAAVDGSPASSILPPTSTSPTRTMTCTRVYLEGQRHSRRACYYTELLALGGRSSVSSITRSARRWPSLVGEQLFVSGCRLLARMTSSAPVTRGRLPPVGYVRLGRPASCRFGRHCVEPRMSRLRDIRRDSGLAQCGILILEMEAAGLYAFARQQRVLCLARASNRMDLIGGDFKQGVADGAQDSLDVLLRPAPWARSS
jgi:hypothetical protein